MQPSADLNLLSLIQWLSPAFPTGGYAYSHGLEQAATDATLTNAATLNDWLTAILTHGSGRQDAILLACALRPDADLDALTALAVALASSAERHHESLAQGTALAQTLAAMTGRTLKPRPLPVALGEAAAPLGLPLPQILALFLHAFASNLVQCMVRFVPLGQTGGQVTLAALHPLIAHLAQTLASATTDDLASSTFGAEMAAMRHETLQPRIFKT
jgi:urease accessory protein